MGRLRRFLHIERSRAPAREGGAPDPRATTAGRFSGVQRPGERPRGAPVSGGHLERFGPEPPPAIDLVETAAGERPFTRCMRCGMDHHVFATECSGCGASLDTEAQREFNEQLWLRRREEAAREEAAATARREAQARAEAELAAQRRAMGEAMAREVGERERRRLGDDGEGWGGRVVLPGWLTGAGAGKLLLAAAGVALVALVVAALLGHPRPLLVVGAILLSLLLPGRRRRRWWWWR